MKCCWSVSTLAYHKYERSSVAAAASSPALIANSEDDPELPTRPRPFALVEVVNALAIGRENLTAVAPVAVGLRPIDIVKLTIFPTLIY